MLTLDYDDRQLQKLFADMEVSKREKALRGAFRRVANSTRKVAVSNLQQTDINNASALASGVRAIVYKRKTGFRVTIAPKKANRQGKGERSMHLNRQGLKKPVLLWAERGTVYRKTKSRVRVKGAYGKWYTTGLGRGAMSRTRYEFMKRTARQVDGKNTAILHDEIRKSIARTAKKYGCK